MRTAARSFRDLLVWRRAHQFVLDVYRVTATLPKCETYGLAAQMRRAAVSIPANIAEGFRRRTRIDKARFLNIAQGSGEECRYYGILIQDLGYAETSGLLHKLDDVTALLDRYIKATIAENATHLRPTESTGTPGTPETTGSPVTTAMT